MPETREESEAGVPDSDKGKEELWQNNREEPKSILEAEEPEAKEPETEEPEIKELETEVPETEAPASENKRE
ncbi:hypothetical protein E5329_12900 [Petralouisia muris]|uniref:Uncharacterized protein n=1 Tax=Petralouisia muris TaxID=3032872 RepID=A0AC61RVB0_9FIRM|nr:hypothetical protein [Petralouisia muris]TGY95871.1 hypothetical protein E5329_12900 [Petralouisia muris]